MSRDRIYRFFFGQCIETSDLIADYLQQWWESHRHKYQQIKKLAINLDNGPSVESHRTQFLKRLVEFSENSGLIIRLIYYPPYNIKYNPVEHCWGVLEKYLEWRDPGQHRGGHAVGVEYEMER